jgi:hypothetical protein
MGLLRTDHTLTWTMSLSEGGYTCWTLVDERGVRWGWLVNAGATGWMAHTGDWGQADSQGVDAPPVAEHLEQFDTAGDGRIWVEEHVAVAWREHARAVVG